MRRRHAYDDSSGCVALTLRVYQEEGGYERASYNKDGEHSKEARIEPAVLYQPLVGSLAMFAGFCNEG
jgi:hypothetical protein